MTVPRCTATDAPAETHRHTMRAAVCGTEDMRADVRAKLVDFIVHRAFYPVLMADRSGPHRAMIERLRVAAQDSIDRFRAYGSVEEVIDGFRRDLGSKAALAAESELRLLHLPVINALRDDFSRMARDLGLEPDTSLTSLAQLPRDT